MNAARPFVAVFFCGAVLATAAERAWHFPTDILPRLTQAGCNAGKCHGAATGQGGFKLSLLGDDPAADHAAITRERGGRRIDFANPERSLFLRKPSRDLDHKGGQKLRAQSADWKAVRDWIAAGAPFGKTDLQVTKLVVTPAELRHSAQLKVMAHFSDGQTRDVTAMALYTTQNDAVATVGKTGQVTIERSGLGAIMIRAAGQVTAARVAVPFKHELKNDFPKPHNFIDEKVFAELSRMRIPVSPLAGDVVFLRRATLDLAGRLPTSTEVRAFIKNPNREKLINRLIGSEAFVDFWTLKFADLLLIDSKKLGAEPARAYRDWLRAQIKNNTPMNQVARALLTARGNLTQNAAANFQRQKTDPRDMGEFVSQTLLGIRVACARCHNHPFDRWTQADYHRFAAFFARTRVKGGELVLVERGEVRHPRTEKVVLPSPLGASKTAKADGLDYRPALADWLTHPDNPFFARAMANRVWREMMGRGLVEPVDDLRVSNPPANPALLDALAASFVKNKFDLRRLIHDITTSRAYQLSSLATAANRTDTQLFSHAYLKPLPAPVKADAIAQATGQPNVYAGQPKGTRAVQLLDAQVPSYTLDVFGRCPRTDNCADPTQFGGGLSSALHLINDPALNKKLGPAVAALLKIQPQPNAMLDEMFLRTLSRFPNDKERAQCLKHIAEVKGTKEGWQDLLWALLNTREFGFNH
ncbi:MAG TPA: DUF1553 domain-containing protein [Verrucomicrobia bacterium]|nr:DUF1553 domain-containing protein [Verrucomicrobiota bacterium]